MGGTQCLARGSVYQYGGRKHPPIGRMQEVQRLLRAHPWRAHLRVLLPLVTEQVVPTGEAGVGTTRHWATEDLTLR